MRASPFIIAAICAVCVSTPLSVRASDNEKKAATAKTAVVPDAAAIAKIGLSLNDAFSRRDANLLRVLATPDFTFTCSSCGGKTETLTGEKALIHAAKWVMGGATEAIDPSINLMQFYSIQDTTAQAGMVTLTMKHEVEYPASLAQAGKETAFTYETRQTWVRTGDAWKLKSLVRL